MAARATSILLQLGVVAVILAALPYKLFELDRYFVPKELALNVVALAILAMLLFRRRTVTVDATDALFGLFLAWSLASALFATNYWLAQRALGVSVSSVLIFWGARRLGALGFRRQLLAAAALATVLTAGVALSQAYGLETEYFSLNRAPGGTLGNRNFVAHIAAIGFSTVVWSTVTARRSSGAFLGTMGAAVVAAALVLSRSRAAWLAVAATALVLASPVVISRKYWDRRRIGGRFARLMLAVVIGAIVAMVLPNSLNWNSDSPYLDSARGMVDYSRGSGRGRVAQYRNSLRMAGANPILGVGPGNWPVRYARFAPAGDRSIADDGMTANPWPSGDWIAFISERGFVAALALLGAFATLFLGSLRRWRDLPDGDAVLSKLVLSGTIVATMVVSAFDAALLLAAPAILVWTILGATSGARSGGRALTPGRRGWALVAIGMILIVVASAIRSGAEVMAMSTVGRGGQMAGWVRGAAWDPGSYRINVRVAELYSRRGRCAVARGYARRAINLFPNAPGAKRVLRGCGGRV